MEKSWTKLKTRFILEAARRLRSGASATPDWCISSSFSSNLWSFWPEITSGYFKMWFWKGSIPISLSLKGLKTDFKKTGRGADRAAEAAQKKIKVENLQKKKKTKCLKIVQLKQEGFRVGYISVTPVSNLWLRVWLINEFMKIKHPNTTFILTQQPTQISVRGNS